MEKLLMSLDLQFITDPVTKTITIYNDLHKCIYKYYMAKKKLHRVADNVYFYDTQAVTELEKYREDAVATHTKAVMSCRLSANIAEGVGVPVCGVAAEKSPLRQRFEEDVKASRMTPPSVLIAVVELPSGAREVITNTDHIETKIEYYLDKYDEQFCLKTCSDVKIIGIMIV